MTDLSLCNTDLIGVTERADPTINLKWQRWVKDGKPAILITKNPKLLLPMLSLSDNVIVHCTITLMGGSILEPNIPGPLQAVSAYHSICSFLGKERVVLRVDPIVDGTSITALKELVLEAEGRVRISFLDLYPHSRKRMERAGIEVVRKAFHMPFLGRLNIWRELGKPEVCAEPGLPSTPCVSKVDCKILGVKPSTRLRRQRSECHCLANKIELCNWPPKCTYGCLYCYWKDEDSRRELTRKWTLKAFKESTDSFLTSIPAK